MENIFETSPFPLIFSIMKTNSNVTEMCFNSYYFWGEIIRESSWTSIQNFTIQIKWCPLYLYLVITIIKIIYTTQ